MPMIDVTLPESALSEDKRDVLAADRSGGEVIPA